MTRQELAFALARLTDTVPDRPAPGQCDCGAFDCGGHDDEVWARRFDSGSY